MKDPLIVSRAAIAATVGFAGLAVFQLLLAAGVPWGEAAWGGSHEGTLPASLRIGSAGSLLVYAVAPPWSCAVRGSPCRG
jgi:hypothetical protein